MSNVMFVFVCWYVQNNNNWIKQRFTRRLNSLISNNNAHQLFESNPMALGAWSIQQPQRALSLSPTVVACCQMENNIIFYFDCTQFTTIMASTKVFVEIRCRSWCMLKNPKKKIRDTHWQWAMSACVCYCQRLPHPLALFIPKRKKMCNAFAYRNTLVWHYYSRLFLIKHRQAIPRSCYCSWGDEKRKRQNRGGSQNTFFKRKIAILFIFSQFALG